LWRGAGAAAAAAAAAGSWRPYPRSGTETGSGENRDEMRGSKMRSTTMTTGAKTAETETGAMAADNADIARIRTAGMMMNR